MARPRPLPPSSSSFTSPASLPFSLPLPLFILLLFLLIFLFLLLLASCFHYDRVRPLTRKERRLIARTIPSDKNNLPPFRFVVVKKLVARHVARRLAIVPTGLLLRGPPAGSIFAPFGEWGWMVFDYLASVQTFQNGEPVTLEQARQGLGPFRSFIFGNIFGERHWKSCGKIGPVYWIDVTPGRGDLKSEEEKEGMVPQFLGKGGERFLLKTNYGSLVFQYSAEQGKFVNV